MTSKDFRKPIRWSIGVVVTSFLLYTTCLLFLTSPFTPRGNIATRAAVGDAFAPLGVFFSGLGLAAVAVTLYLQMRELELQREQLRKQHEVSLLTTYSSVLDLLYNPPSNIATIFETDTNLAAERHRRLFEELNRAVDHLAKDVREIRTTDSDPSFEPESSAQ